MNHNHKHFHHAITVLWLLLSLLCTPLSTQAQTCQDTILATASSVHFIPHNTDNLVDKRTNLIWSRCSIGQHWSNGNCLGTAQQLTYVAAKDEVRNKILKEKQQWRIPTVAELSLLVELRCFNPAIDLQLFPNTPSQSYWTTTRFVNKLKHHWLIQFRFGANHVDKDINLAYLRLVRDNN